MSKSYVFKMDKYYTPDEIAAVSPIIENFMNLYADDDGVATLNLKSDISIVVRRDEGAVIHMVLDNPDHFTALPKKLSMAKDFLNTFVTAMAKAVDKKKKETVDVTDAMAKVESDAENSLLGYIGSDPAPTDDVKVKVNGEDVTDPAEKEKVISDVDEIRKRANKMFNDIFDAYFGKKTALDPFSDWLKNYLK